MISVLWCTYRMDRTKGVSMTKPIVADTGHAFLFVLGGAYNSSVLTQSIVTGKYTLPNPPGSEPLIDLHFAGDLEGMWAMSENDYRWVPTEEIMKYVCTPFEELRDEIKRAINDCGGAWVIRVYAKPKRRKS